MIGTMLRVNCLYSHTLPVPVPQVIHYLSTLPNTLVPQISDRKKYIALIQSSLWGAVLLQSVRPSTSLVQQRCTYDTTSGSLQHK